MTQSENKQIELSIVIAAWNGVSLLRDCLLSLEKQIEKGGAEVIVVSNFETGISESKKRFPFAKHIVLS
jgi:glycosyltransferase involved in cell wall biosynthesis